jgi:biofilm protein TabA
MLVESLSNWPKWAKSFTPEFTKAIAFILEQQQNPATPGRYNLDDGMYAIIQVYTTKSALGGQFETHRKYIDLQILTQGIESLYWTSPEIGDPQIPYSMEKDIEFFKPRFPLSHYCRIVLEPHRFCLLWPQDWHMPSIIPENDVPKEVRKIVVKIPV